MLEPLDSHAPTNPPQDAYALSKLQQLAATSETFIWTARPYSLWVDVQKAVAEDHRNAILPFLYYALLGIMVFLYAGLLAALSVGIAVLVLLIVSIFWIQTRRRKTWYGITNKKIWVKKPNRPLKQYPIAQLTGLTAQENSISYSTIQGSEYEKIFLFQRIHEPLEVQQLIFQLQRARLN